MDPAQIQRNVRHNAEDLQSFLRDMGSWEQDMKKKDEQLRQKRQESKQQGLPAVRGRKPEPNASSTEGSSSKGTSSSKIRGSDYSAWDKFDVDKACEEVDEREEMRTCDGTAPAAGAADEEDLTTSEDEDEELARMKELAVAQKDKGNAFFKKGEYSAAIQCYTRGMTADPNNAVLTANRAMALLKCERYAAALQDCEVALSLDPKYVKARLRRAACFVGLGQDEDAKTDFEEVLKLEPGNKQAKADLKKLQQKTAGRQNGPGSSTAHVRTPTRPKSQKPLYRMPIEEVGRPVAVTEIESPSSVAMVTANEPVSAGSRRQDAAEQPQQQQQLPAGMSVSEWLAQDERVIRTHDLLAGSVDSMTSQLPDPEQPTAKSSNAVDHPLSSTAVSTAAQPSSASGRTVSSTATGSQTAASKINRSGSSPLGVPKTAYQLANDLRRLGQDQDRLYMYLKAIAPSSYASILKQSLDSDILSAMLKGFHQCYVGRGESVLAELTALSKAKRFNTAKMLLSSPDTQVLRELFTFMSSLDGLDKADVTRLQTVYLC